MRQAVDQVDVDAHESDVAAVIKEPPRLFVRLNSVDGLLHKRIEILNAHADAVETDSAQHTTMLFSRHARIDFDADLSSRGKGEALFDEAVEIFNLFG